MKELTVTELFDLDETIAGEIFEGITYPWEVLPKIGEFIVNLCQRTSMKRQEKIFGLPDLPKWRRRHVSTDRLSLEKMRKSGTVLLSEGMPW